MDRGAKEAIGGKATDRLAPAKDRQGGEEAGTRGGGAKGADTTGLQTVRTKPGKDGPGPATREGASRYSALDVKGRTKGDKVGRGWSDERLDDVAVEELADALLVGKGTSSPAHN